MAQPVTASLVSKQIDIPDELVSKIADVRDNSTPTDWVLASLSSESEDLGLRVLGTGTGGVTELRELLTQENIFFGLVRTIETIDKTEAVKFVFISFVGEKIGVMRKARISTLRGGIQAAFDPFHCELLNLSSKEEVSEAAIKQELGAMFGGEVAYQQGLGSTVYGEGVMRIGQRMVKVTEKEGPRKVSALSERQAVSMPPELPATIADVRNDTSATNWCLCGFEAAGMGLRLVGSGSGGVAEMAQHLTPDNVFYGLARTTQIFDDPKVPLQVRFCFVSFVGEEVPMMRKAKISTLRGTIAAEFDPIHCELLNVSAQEEVSEAAIAAQLGSHYGRTTDASSSGADGSATMRFGQKTITVSEKGSPQLASKTTPTKYGGAAVHERQDVALPAELPAAVADVRNDTSATNWALCGLDGERGTAIRMIGSGSGGVAELAALLTQDNICYGLVRTTETIDQTEAVKFVFLSFLGEKVAPMRKAKISTLKGTITEAFAPFHAELLNASSRDEVTAPALAELLRRSQGATGNAQATARKESKVVVAKSMAGADAVYAAPQAAAASEAVRAAVAAVRSDADKSSWCLLGYSGDRAPALTVVATGEGAAEEMAAHLTQDALLYALVRVNQTIDASVTVKFALVSWVGEDVPPLRQAKLASMRGQASQLLSPYHTELLNVATAAEVTHAAIMKQLA